jgi:uncharacterized protein
MGKQKRIFKDALRTEDGLTRVEDGFANFATRVGLNTGNSLSESFYALNLLTRNRLQLEAAYRGSWVAGAMVDAIAEDMTKSGIDIISSKEDSNIRQIQTQISRKQIWSSLSDAIKWGRLYGGSIAVFQIEGHRLDVPLDLSTISKGQFKGLAVYDRWQLQPDLVRVIQEGPNIGLPEYYDIVSTSSTGEPAESSLASQIAGQPSQTNHGGYVKVHHSRVMRFIGIQLPFFQAITEMMWGESVLERLWDRLISFDDATLSASNLVERANNRTVQIDGLRNIIATGGDAQKGLEAMFDMMRQFQTNEGLTLLDKDDVFQTTSYSFAGLSDLLLQFSQQLSGGTTIPLVRLFGQSPAGLSSTGESDIRNYYDSIYAKQESDLRPGMDVLLKILWRSTFGKDAPDDLEFSFVPLWQMSAKEKSDIAKQNAETIASIQEMGLIGRATALKELRDQSKKTGLFVNIKEDDILEAEKEDAESPPMPELGDLPNSIPENPDAPQGSKENDGKLDSKWARAKSTIGKWVGR